jgi:hypothetical protein
MGKDTCKSAIKTILIVLVLQLTDENKTQIGKHGVYIFGFDLALSLHFKATSSILLWLGCDRVNRAKRSLFSLHNKAKPSITSQTSGTIPPDPNKLTGQITHRIFRQTF